MTSVIWERCSRLAAMATALLRDGLERTSLAGSLQPLALDSAAGADDTRAGDTAVPCGMALPDGTAVPIGTACFVPKCISSTAPANPTTRGEGGPLVGDPTPGTARGAMGSNEVGAATPPARATGSLVGNCVGGGAGGGTALGAAIAG
jgi:hypothetical protein